jgi:hypothetical protein
MTTATQYASSFQTEQVAKRGFSLQAIVAALFMVKLRESIDAGIEGDKSDAAYVYGL